MRDAAERVRCLREGDDQAWRDFIREFAPFVRIVARRYGLDASNDAELLQEMTVTALRSIGNLRDPERLRSWTFTIANRAAVNLWRARARFRTETGGEAVISSLRSPEVSADEMIARSEDAARLHEALVTLGTPCRGILTGLFLEVPRPSYGDLASRLGVPIGSIGPNLARCLLRLRRALQSVSRAPSAASAGTERDAGASPAE